MQLCILFVHILRLNKMKECKPFIWKKKQQLVESTPGNVGSAILFLHMGCCFPVGLSTKLTHCSQLVQWAPLTNEIYSLNKRRGARWFPIVESFKGYPESIGEIKREHQQIVIPYRSYITDSDNKGLNVWFLYGCTATNLYSQNNKAKTWEQLPSPIVISS